MIAVVIRAVVRPARFEGSHRGEGYVILALIAGVVLTLLCWHAAATAAGLETHAGFLSKEFAHAFPHSGVLERVFVWAHLCFIFGFLVYLPYSKHLHIATAAVNVWFARTRARGKLTTLDFTLPDAELRFGAGTVADLTWKQIMDGFSCTECGRCQDACPAHATGKILSPKLLIMGIRDQVFAQSAEPIAGHGVPEEMIWDCVTCGACVQACPVSIEHVDHIVDLRRHLVMVESKFPVEAEPMLRDVERASNPWGKPQTGAGGVGGGARRARARAGRPGAGVPVLGRLRGVVRRAGEEERGVDGEAAAEGGRRLRHPRPARVVHGRSGAADGERVRLPGVRGAERVDAERVGRDEDRRELPALLQHARERVRRLRRRLRGAPPHGAARAAGARAAACSRRRGASRSRTTTRAISRATTTCASSRGSF